MKRYTEEEKAEILKEVESLRNVSLVAKKHGMPATTIQNWIRKGLNLSDSSEIRKLIWDIGLKETYGDKVLRRKRH